MLHYNTRTLDEVVISMDGLGPDYPALLREAANEIERRERANSFTSLQEIQVGGSSESDWWYVSLSFYTLPLYREKA